MTINERVERRLIGATQIVQPKTILRWQRAGFKTFWRWKSRRHMDAVRIACIKPLLLREAVKEAVAVESRNCSPRNRRHGRPRDASENHSPMDGASEGQATDGRSGRGLRQKGRRAEQVSAR